MNNPIEWQEVGNLGPRRFGKNLFSYSVDTEGNLIPLAVRLVPVPPTDVSTVGFLVGEGNSNLDRNTLGVGVSARF